MSPCETTAAVTAIANSIACKFKTDELAIIGALFVQLGDTIAALALMQEKCEADCKQKNK